MIDGRLPHHPELAETVNYDVILGIDHQAKLADAESQNDPDAWFDALDGLCAATIIANNRKKFEALTEDI